jgi:glutamate/tyrosine decarboxylase-like PLP-dependent enzyme
MSITASYLGPATAGERNPAHFVPELSRRARGFATWVMIRTLGREGIARMVAQHCRPRGTWLALSQLSRASPWKTILY